MSFAHLLTDTLTIASPNGIAASGDPSFGTQSTTQARVEFTDKIVKDGNGREHQASHKVATESQISLGARVWLPDDNTSDNNAAKRVVARTGAASPNGPTIYETYLA